MTGDAKAVYLDPIEARLIATLRELPSTCKHIAGMDLVAASFAGVALCVGLAHNSELPEIADITGKWIALALNAPEFEFLATLAGIMDLPETP